MYIVVKLNHPPSNSILIELLKRFNYKDQSRLLFNNIRISFNLFIINTHKYTINQLPTGKVHYDFFYESGEITSLTQHLNLCHYTQMDTPLTC